VLHELQAHGGYFAFEPGELTAIPLAYGVFCAVFAFFALPLLYSPHSFRVTTLTDLFEQGVHSEDVQHLAGHADGPDARRRTLSSFQHQTRSATKNS
jgi:hypothetical protein